MMEKIKENGALIGVIVFVLVIVVFIFTSESNGKKSAGEKKNENTPIVLEAEVPANTFASSFKVEGKDEGSLEYSFVLPAEVKAVTEEGGSFVIATRDGKPFAKVYFTDLRTNQRTGAEYLNKIIAPQVKEFSLKEIVPVGSFSWQKGESVTMEWHAAPVLDGKFLAFVENYKTENEAVAKLLASMKVGMTMSSPAPAASEVKTNDASKPALEMEVGKVETDVSN